MTLPQQPQTISMEKMLQTIGFLYFQSNMQTEKIQQLQTENQDLKDKIGELEKKL